MNKRNNRRCAMKATAEHKYHYASNAPRLHKNSTLANDAINNISVVELQQQVSSFAIQFGFTVNVRLSVTKEVRGHPRQPFGTITVRIPRHTVETYERTGSTQAISEFVTSAVRAGKTGPQHNMPKFICTGVYK